jgi:hypothetical protein
LLHLAEFSGFGKGTPRLVAAELSAVDIIRLLNCWPEFVHSIITI